MKVQTKAQLRFLRMSPPKVRLLIDAIRGKKIAQAQEILKASPKQAARPVLKLLQSAVANALHNDKAQLETLTVHTAFVDGGPILYRWMPKAHGRATKIRKRTSHITIVLEGEGTKTTDNGQQTTDKKKKTTKKKASVADSTPSTEKKTAPKKKTAAKNASSTATKKAGSTTKKAAPKKKASTKKAAPKKK